MNRFTFTLFAAIVFMSCSKQSKNDKNEVEKLVATESTNTFEANGRIVFNNDDFYEAAAARSANLTFGDGSTATIKKIEVLNFPQGTIQTIFYTTNNRQESSFTVIDNNVLQQRVTVDCYGTCDCRERLIMDANGNPKSYECTCDKCKMDVVTTAD